MTDFINDTSDLNFFDDNSGIYSKFDKMNLVDFYLFNIFIHHGDFWNHNYYIIRNKMPSKFFLIPWDFDNSFGQYSWYKYEPDNIFSCFGRNLLFERLRNNEKFIKELSIRWAALRAD